MIIHYQIKMRYRTFDDAFNSKPNTSDWSDATMANGQGECSIEFDVEAASLVEAQEKINKAFQKLVNEK